MKNLETHICCDKTLQLVRKSLKVGSIDPVTKLLTPTSEGTPQGNISSPLIANILLNELDKKVEELKNTYEKGKKRAKNKAYDKLSSRIQNLRARSKNNRSINQEIRKLGLLRRSLPSYNPMDTEFKRLLYIRNADDFVILVIGSKHDAKLIKHRIADILNKKCGLELNATKTLITATKKGFKFLGAQCIKVSTIKAGLQKTQNGVPAKFRMKMRVEIPIQDLILKLKVNKYIKIDSKGRAKATAKKGLINLSHYEILKFFNHRIQGLINYYSFAANLASM